MEDSPAGPALGAADALAPVVAPAEVEGVRHVETHPRAVAVRGRRSIATGAGFDAELGQGLGDQGVDSDVGARDLAGVEPVLERRGDREGQLARVVDRAAAGGATHQVDPGSAAGRGRPRVAVGLPFVDKDCVGGNDDLSTMVVDDRQPTR